MFDHSDNRLTPEESLAKGKLEKSRSSKGKLKIFLGMAAGVGKTYSMLEEAELMRLNGIDILVGIVDTHGRSETELLLENLKVLPCKKVVYRDKIFDELNLELIIERKPQIILIDELAHTNIPGVRHLKRWEDVLEILDNGIDVYTTLNIQHIESLKNIVESLAEITIRETVPDFIFSENTSIQLVDLTPDELLTRLYNGRVYIGTQSKIAARNFFQKERLMALREITLRFVAEIVDSDLRGMIPQHTSNPNDKILVAISHYPHSQKLIRTARRLAFNLDIPWIALHVNDNRHLSESDNSSLSKNIELAQDLGAEVISSNNLDIALGIKHIAQLHKVNLIIVGRSHKSMHLINKHNLFERLARECNDIDILVIKEEYAPVSRNYCIIKFAGDDSLLAYLNVMGLTLLTAATNWVLYPYIGYKFCAMIFMSTTVLFSLFFKKGPVFASLFTSVIIWATFFITPEEIFELFTPEYLALTLLYLLTVLSIGTLVDRIWKQKEMLVSQEESIQAIYEIVHHILKNTSINETLDDIETCLERTLGGSCEILIKEKNSLSNDVKKLTLDEKEKNAALWVLENDKEAGLSTSTLPFCNNFYIPVKGFDRPVAVIVYRPQGKMIVDNEKNFLYTVGQHLSLYIAQYEQRESA